MPGGPYLVIVGAQVAAQHADGRPRRHRHGASAGPVPPHPHWLRPRSARPAPASPPGCPLSPPRRGGAVPPPDPCGRRACSLRARGAGRSLPASRVEPSAPPVGAVCAQGRRRGGGPVCLGLGCRRPPMAAPHQSPTAAGHTYC